MATNPLQSLLDQLEPGASPAELGKRVASHFAAQPLGEGGVQYAEACTWYGALRVAELLDESDLSRRLIARYEPLFGAESARSPLPRAQVEDRVLGMVALEIARQTNDPRFLEAGLRFADAQRQTPSDDGLNSEVRFRATDLFLLTALQVQAHRVTHQAVYLEQAASTALTHIACLQQPSGLFHHTQASPVSWGRSNGWAAAGITELLLELPSSHPSRARISLSFERLLQALLLHQDFTGGFRQLICVRDAWLEMSGTAMFAFAMITALRHGWVDVDAFPPPARDAWHCVVDHVDAAGNLSAICSATGEAFDEVGSEPAAQERFYLRRPRERGDHHGQAPLLWTIAALLS